MIQRDGYEFADDDTYRDYAAAMRDRARELREAVNRKDYDAAPPRPWAKSARRAPIVHAGYRSNN